MELTKKSALWSEECKRAFEALKRALCTDPVLISPDLAKRFVLQTDASDRGVGAVLSQLGADGHEHPVGYCSKKLLPPEQHYSTIEKECLAIKLAVEPFRVHLLGRRFVIQTDHRSLEWLEKLKNQTHARLCRWSLSFQPYIFEVQHRAGVLNQNAALPGVLPRRGKDVSARSYGHAQHQRLGHTY